jgi:flagellin
MSLVINTNIASLQAQQNLNTSQGQLNTSLERLSSGLRINSAADDPAGLAIADRFTTQINGLNQASQNANDAISLAQTAGGALQQVTNNLQTIRQLAVESANSSNSTSDRQALDQEVQQDISEINRIATQTSFNGQNVLDGTFGNAVFQVGANVGQTIGVDLSTSVKTSAIGQFVNATGTVANGPTVAVTGATTATAPTVSATTQTQLPQGVSATPFDGSLTYSITPNGGTATAIQSSSAFAGTLTGQGADSAYAKAAAINGSGINGVTATATNVLDIGSNGTAGTLVSVTGATGDTTGTETYNLSINGVQAVTSGAITGTNATAVTVQSAISQINQVSSQTGVTASADANGGLLLTAADGRDIQLQESVTGTTGNGTAGNTVVKSALSNSTSAFGTVGGTVGTSSGTYGGQVTLQSGASLTLSAGAQAALGFSNSIQSTSSSLAQQNVLTIAGANNTILAVDSALTTVDSLQATFGAIQNRFDSAIASLGTAVTNLSAARSQVQDANFASETSNLTRAQILQQAGVSILAQANALPQGVLKLLQ